MTDGRAQWWRPVVFALARGGGFLLLALAAYLTLHGLGLWDPMPIESWALVALLCALSLALWLRWPAVHLLVIAAVVANPMWRFGFVSTDYGSAQVRVIPLVLAAYLTARAGLRLAVVLPVVTVAAVLSQYSAWPEFIDLSFAELWNYVLLIGLSQPLLLLGVALASALLGRAGFRQERTTRELRARNEELIRLREADRRRVANEARTEIAREVHDVVAHHLAALVVRAQAAARVADRDPLAPRAAVDWIAEAGPQALAEMRGLVRVLRTGDADHSGIAMGAVAAIEAAAERIRAAGVDVRTSLEGPPELPVLAEFAIVRVCQEALTNVLVHSRAASVDVRLSAADGVAVLVVEDDGATAARAAPPLAGAAGGGSGIRGMRERAAAAGGTVTAGATERGWRVELVVPVTAPDPAGERA